jgi:Caspase domain
MKNNITLICFLLASGAMGQNFSGKTNDIVLNFKKPLNTSTAISLPIIKWVKPKPEYTNNQSNAAEIEAYVTSETDIKSIKLLVGDGTIPRGEKSLDLITPRVTTVKQQIKLLDGQNVIELVVENIQGGKVSSSRSILVGSDAIADAISLNRKDYVLLFATDQYDNWSDLVNPINDAQSLAKVLNEKYGFQTEVVQNPTQDEVFNKLHDYAERKFKPQDQLMIFFAGHGYFDETFGEGFVVAKNSLENDKAKSTYISHNRLRGIIQNIPCEHIFLAMDVCFGGTFDPVIASARGMDAGEASNTEYLVRKLSQRTRKYLTSGGKEYVSDGIPGKHSPFTLKLLQALSDGGGSDQIVTLTEIKTYVEKLKPEPRMGSFGDDRPESDFVFVLKN